MDFNRIQNNASHCTHGSLTSIYGWLFQCILATLAFACLIVKRFCEPSLERRSWLVWFFDTSKQAIGSLIVHFINILIAEHLAKADPCTLYIISFLLDSSIGLLIVYILIRLVVFLAIKLDFKSLVFGEYGFPKPQFNFWLYQCVAYIIILLFQKIIITLILQWRAWDQVRDLILWHIPNPEFEVAFVILIIPFVVNVFMFWVTDNFLTMSRTFKPKLNFTNSGQSVKRKIVVLKHYISLPVKAITLMFSLMNNQKTQLKDEDDDDNLVEINLDTIENNIV